MREELQSKDRCIADLLKKIEQLDRTVSLFRDQKSREYTTASSGGQQMADNSLVHGVQIMKLNKSRGTDPPKSLQV
jgi:hypothetical protein